MRYGFLQSRWPDGFSCLRCGGHAAFSLPQRGLFQCKACGYQASVTAGTILHGTRTPLRQWFRAAYLMTTLTPGISALQLQRQRVDAQCIPALIICPTSLVENWAEEAERFTPELRVLRMHGSERHKHWDRIEESDLIVTSYALIRRDLDQYLQYRFSIAVLDEAQHIKNRTTQNAAAVKQKQAVALHAQGAPGKVVGVAGPNSAQVVAGPVQVVVVILPGGKTQVGRVRVDDPAEEDLRADRDDLCFHMSPLYPRTKIIATAVTYAIRNAR